MRELDDQVRFMSSLSVSVLERRLRKITSRAGYLSLLTPLPVRDWPEVAAAATYARAYKARCEHAIDLEGTRWRGSSREGLERDGPAKSPCHRIAAAAGCLPGVGVKS
jgi:hypothetical protein